MKIHKLLMLLSLAGIILLSGLLFIIEKDGPIGDTSSLATGQLIARSYMVNSPVVITNRLRPTPIILTRKKEKALDESKSIPIYHFPQCYSQPGWYYGWHSNGLFEYGTDFDCDYHTVALALWTGTVVEAERTQWGNYNNTAGGLVVIAANVPGLGIEGTYYLHLDIIYVTVGQYIRKGTAIGLTGGQIGYGNWPTAPWFTSGPHIEIGFDYPYGKTHIGKNVNPLWYIEEAIK